MALLDEAQADTAVWVGPRTPSFIEMRPGAILLMSIGMKKGDSRSGPCSLITLVCCSMVVMPPMPDPMMTPMVSRFASVISKPESATASCAAIQANWAKRSILRASFLPMIAAGSKSRTSAAKRVARLDASNKVM